MLDALQEVASYTYSAINLWHPKAQPGSVVAAVSRGFDMATMSVAYHQTGCAELDLLSQDILRQRGRAMFVNGDDARLAAPSLAPVRLFLQRFDIAHSLGIALPIEGSESCALIYANRDDSHPPFDAHDADRLTLASPHLIEALMVNRLRASTQGMEDLADIPMVQTLPDGWFIYPNACFIDVWAALSALNPELRVPRWPPGWLVEGFIAAPPNYLGEEGWQVRTMAMEDGWRIELHPPASSGPLEKLTLREREVARLYGAGFSHKEIARELAISPNTARVHIANIFSKLHISTRFNLRRMSQS